MAELELIFKYYLLMFVRVGAILILFPGFGSVSFPRIAKVFIIFAISMVVVMQHKAMIVPAFNDNIIYSVFIIKEAFIGFFIGFFAQLPFLAVKAAGDIISFNTMFSFATVLDPMQNQSVTLWGEFYDLFAILIFFVINGHLLIVKAINYSFDKISVLQSLVFHDAVLTRSTEVLSTILFAGMAIAAPIVLVLFVSNISMGIISRTMPQFNVLMVGMPLQIMLAFIIIIFTLPMDAGIIKNIFSKMYADIHYILGAL
jgi:flagellar biosynthetic protein FliR